MVRVVNCLIMVTCLCCGIGGAQADDSAATKSDSSATVKDAKSVEQWGPPMKGLRMSVALLKEAKFGPFDRIVLKVMIENTSDKEIDLGMSATDFGSFDIAVEYVGGGLSQKGRVPITKFGTRLLQEYDSAKNVPIRLKPGNRRNYRFVVNRMYDMTLSGDYSITLNRYVPGRSRLDGGGNPIPNAGRNVDELVSNTILVKIIEPPPLTFNEK